MKKIIHMVLLASLLGVTTIVDAGMIPFKKYRILSRGMSAAEVLYRVGPPDFRQLRDPHWTNKQTWFYVPTQTDRDPWQTVIQFDAWGYIQRIDRDKIIRSRY